MSEPLKATLKGAYALGLVSRVCDVFFYFVVFRDLPIREVGLFGWTMAIAVFVSFVLDLGASQLLIRLFTTADQRGSEIAFAALALRLITGLLLLCAWALSVSQLSAEQSGLLLLMLALQLTISLQQVPLAWYRAHSNQRAANLFGAVEASSKLLGVGLLATLLHAHLTATTVVAALASIQGVLCLALFLIFLPRIRPLKASMQLVLLRMKGLVRVGAVFLAIGLCTVIQNRLDWLLLSSFGSATDLAGYSLANKVYEFALMFFGIGLTTVYPWLCRSDMDALRMTRIALALRVLVYVALALGWLVASLAPEILFVLFREKYKGFELHVAAFAALSGYSVMVATLYFMVLAERREKLIALICVGATAIQAAANIFLIPRWGASGALAGMITLVGVTLVAYVFVDKRNGRGHGFDSGPLLLASCAFAAVAVVRLASYANIAASAALFALTIVVTFVHVFSRRDRILLRQWGQAPLMRTP